MGARPPADYRSFIDTYGPGTFGEIAITAPEAPAGFDLYRLLRRAIETARAPDAIRTVPTAPLRRRVSALIFVVPRWCSDIAYRTGRLARFRHARLVRRHPSQTFRRWPTGL